MIDSNINVLHHQLEEDQKKSAEAQITIVAYDDDSDPPQLNIAPNPLGNLIVSSGGPSRNSSSHMMPKDIVDPIMLFLDP